MFFLIQLLVTTASLAHGVTKTSLGILALHLAINLHHLLVPGGGTTHFTSALAVIFAAAAT